MNTFHLSCKKPFSYQHCLSSLYRSPDEILYQVKNDRIYRLLTVNDTSVAIEIHFDGEQLVVNSEKSLNENEISELKSYISRWFDLDKDLKPFYDLLNGDDRLSHLADQFKGLRIVGIPDAFEAICWSIIGQQINLSFAHKLKRRLIEHYGEKASWQGMDLHLFPSPEAILDLDEHYLHSQQQFSRSKLKYLKNIAEAFASGNISYEKLRSLESFEERQALLTSVKGIGIWSANYTLMKALNQPEAIPYGDTGLSQALFNLEIIQDRKDIGAIEHFFHDFPGWEAYLVFYLWKSLS